MILSLDISATPNAMRFMKSFLKENDIYHGVVLEWLLTEISERPKLLSVRVTIKKKHKKTWQVVQFMHLFPNIQLLPMHLNVFSELYIYLSDMFKSIFTLKEVTFF